MSEQPHGDGEPARATQQPVLCFVYTTFEENPVAGLLPEEDFPATPATYLRCTRCNLTTRVFKDTRDEIAAAVKRRNASCPRNEQNTYAVIFEEPD